MTAARLLALGLLLAFIALAVFATGSRPSDDDQFIPWKHRVLPGVRPPDMRPDGPAPVLPGRVSNPPTRPFRVEGVNPAVQAPDFEPAARPSKGVMMVGAPWLGAAPAPFTARTPTPAGPAAPFAADPEQIAQAIAIRQEQEAANR